MHFVFDFLHHFSPSFNRPSIFVLSQKSFLLIGVPTRRGSVMKFFIFYNECTENRMSLFEDNAGVEAFVPNLLATRFYQLIKNKISFIFDVLVCMLCSLEVLNLIPIVSRILQAAWCYIRQKSVVHIYYFER